jgi:hypothetical protein
MLLPLMIILASLGAAALVLGAVLMLTARGESRDLTAGEVGADIVRHQMRDTGAETPLVEGAVFEGKGGGKAIRASSSFGEVKADLRAGRHRQALPPLLILFGLTGLLVFGSLALLVGLESKLVGGVLLAATVLALGRQVLAFLRA